MPILENLNIIGSINDGANITAKRAEYPPLQSPVNTKYNRLNPTTNSNRQIVRTFEDGVASESQD